MKTILILLLPFTSIAQIRPFFGGGIGHLKGVAVEVKAGATVGNVIVEGAAAFSQVLPFQHSIKVGYSVGSDWYATPFVGAAFYNYSQDAKDKNYTRPAAGIEAGRRIDLTGTYGGEVFSAAQIHISYFGRWLGVGIRMVL